MPALLTNAAGNAYQDNITNALSTGARAMTDGGEISEAQVEAAREAYAVFGQQGHLRALPPSKECVRAMLQAAARAADDEAAGAVIKNSHFAWDSTPAENARLRGEVEKLREALRMMRTLIKESGGVPRYTVTPGAALNSFVEETLDPLLKDAT